MEDLNHLLSGGAVADVLFYVFAALTLLCGLLVIVNPFSRNPVTSAMFLVLTIISMSGLFVLLHAFVIMLLDLKEEQRRKIKMFGLVAGLLAVGGIVSALMKSAASVGPGGDTFKTEGDTISLGKLLFTNYTLPFEIVSVLLLVAMIGVILLSKKKLE